MDEVYVVVYNDIENLSVDVDVFYEKPDAVRKLSECLALHEEDGVVADYVTQECDEDGDLNYIAIEHEDVIIYECFMIARTIE